MRRTEQAMRIAVPIVMLLGVAAPAAGHRLNVFAYVRGEQVRVKASFRKNSPARECPVTVYGPGDRVLHALRTNATGECDFRPAIIADLRIVADAGEGHRGEFLLLAADLAALTPAGQPATAPASRPSPPPPRDTAPAEAAPEPSELARLRRQIEAIQDQLAEMREPEGVGLQEVINGLCALLGIVGASTLTWYLLERRRDQRGGAS